MLLLAVFAIVSMIGNIVLVVKIWPVSKVYAIATFFFFPAAIFFMFAHWGDDDFDIKVPFIVTLLSAIGTMYQLDKIADEYGLWDEEEEESRLYEGRRIAALDAFGGHVLLGGHVCAARTAVIVSPLLPTGVGRGERGDIFRQTREDLPCGEA